MIQPCWSKLTIATIAIVLVLSFGNGFCFVEGSETDDAPIVWFCDPDALELTTNVFRLSGGRNGQRLLPKEVSSEDFNAGSLVTLCVAVSDKAHSKGIVIQGIENFHWTDYYGNLVQPAVERGVASDNSLTSYDTLHFPCVDSEWCSFSSILFADFYAEGSNVFGSGYVRLAYPQEPDDNGGSISSSSSASTSKTALIPIKTHFKVRISRHDDETTSGDDKQSNPYYKASHHRPWSWDAKTIALLCGLTLSLVIVMPLCRLACCDTRETSNDGATECTSCSGNDLDDSCKYDPTRTIDEETASMSTNREFSTSNLTLGSSTLTLGSSTNEIVVTGLPSMSNHSRDSLLSSSTNPRTRVAASSNGRSTTAAAAPTSRVTMAGLVPIPMNNSGRNRNRNQERPSRVSNSVSTTNNDSETLPRTASAERTISAPTLAATTATSFRQRATAALHLLFSKTGSGAEAALNS